MEDKSCKTPRWRMLKAMLNNITPEQFQQKMADQENAILIDVRRPDEFEKGHLDGAININYFSDDFWQEMEALQDDKDFLIYCRSGRRSIRACTLMKNGGFEASKIFNLDGGIIAWDLAFSN